MKKLIIATLMIVTLSVNADNIDYTGDMVSPSQSFIDTMEKFKDYFNDNNVPFTATDLINASIYTTDIDGAIESFQTFEK